MQFTDRLFKENEAIWNNYLTHPFITGMQDGSLKIEAFKYYLIQDYFYLLEYNKVFAIGISKANKNEDIKFLSNSISNISWEIETVHKKYMIRIGISEEDLIKSSPSLSNIGYTSYMIAKASDGDILNALLSVLSCSWSYAFIGQKIYKNTPNLIKDNIYGEWLQAYSSDEYDKMNKELMDKVDMMCNNLPEKRLEELSNIFKICSEFEMRFWDMAYTLGKSDSLQLEN